MEGHRTADGLPAAAGDAGPARGRSASGGVPLLACAAQFMVVLDVSVVNVALPSVRAELGFRPPEPDLSWVVNAYVLPFAGLLLLGGRLADLYGRRRVLVVGLVLFTLAGLAGGLAAGPGTLVAARAAQGVGAAVLAPVTLTILTTTFPEGPRRARALAAWTAVGVGGGTAGNLVGGVLTQYLSWRATLLLNVPIGALALLLALRRLSGEHAAPATRRRLDVPGAVLATTGLATLTYGLAHSRAYGWGAPQTLGPLAAGALALALFVAVEARAGSDALVPLRLLRVRAPAVGNAAMLLAGACLSPMWYFLTLLLQDGLGYTPLQTALGFLPHTLVTIAVGTRLTPWLMARLDGRTLVVTGALVAAAGFLWQSRMTVESGYAAGILGPAVAVSVGGGLLNTPLTAAVTSGIARPDAGAASGLMNAAKQVGAALGLAALASLAPTGPGRAPYERAFLAIALVLTAVAATALALPGRPSARDVPRSDGDEGSGEGSGWRSP